MLDSCSFTALCSITQSCNHLNRVYIGWSKQPIASHLTVGCLIMREANLQVRLFFGRSKHLGHERLTNVYGNSRVTAYYDIFCQTATKETNKNKTKL